MNNAPDPKWNPDPQLLAAYFDGELEGRDDLADMRARLEAWVEEHAEARQEWAKHQQLQKLWLETTPAEPGAADWNQTLERIDTERRRPVASPSVGGSWMCTLRCVTLLSRGVIASTTSEASEESETGSAAQSAIPSRQ